MSRDWDIRTIGEEHLIGANIHSLQNDPKASQRGGSNIGPGMAGAYSRVEEVANLLPNFLKFPLLTEHFARLNYSLSEDAQGLSNLNASLSGSYIKKALAPVPVQQYEGEDEQDQEVFK